jgi:carbon monoxide dehydrogenase subunit G
MIETEQTILIDAGIDGVWGYVHKIPNWAEMMPGLRECSVIDENDSRWTLKVGVGGMVRTVNVQVHVDEWDGPERVRFSYKLEGDPVEGGGTYLATSKGPGQTEVTLTVRVEGGGPMAPMWEAMGKPLLPQFAKAFAGQLKTEIEKAVAAAPAAATEAAAAPVPAPSLFGAMARWLRKLWRAIFGPRAEPLSREEGGTP